MKKVLFCIICIITILTLTGCSKTAITSPDFKTKLEGQGYSVSGFDDDRSIEAQWAAKDDVINIKFYEFDSLQNAIKDFNAIEKEWAEEANNSYKTRVSTNVSNYSNLALTFDGKYKYLCRVEKTVLRIDTDEDHKNEVKELVKSLGY